MRFTYSGLVISEAYLFEFVFQFYHYESFIIMNHYETVTFLQDKQAIRQAYVQLFHVPVVWYIISGRVPGSLTGA